MCLRNAVMPGELVFVQEAPGVSQAERNERENRCEYAPASQISRGGRAIEAGDSQIGGAQTGRGPTKNQKSELIGEPQCYGERCGNFGRNTSLRERSIEAQKHVSKNCGSARHDESIYCRGEDSARKARSLQRHVNARLALRLRLARRLDENSSKGRRCRQKLSGFYNPGTVSDRLGQLIRVER